MCIEANHFLSEDMERAMKQAEKAEQSPLGKQILEQLEENLQIAADDMIPICQDTGMAVIFLEIGQDVHLQGVHWRMRSMRGYVRDMWKDFYENPSSKILLFVKIQKIIHLRSFIIKLWKVRK